MTERLTSALPNQEINLLQGDCLELMEQIQDNTIDMVMTDPPYGTTACAWDSVIPLDDLWYQLKAIVKNDGAIVMTAAQPFTTQLISSNMEMFKYEWIWEKDFGTGFLNAKRQPLRKHENVCVFYKKNPTYNPQLTVGRPYSQKGGVLNPTSLYGDHLKSSYIEKTSRYPLSIQKFSHDRDGIHPTQKPVGLMMYLIKTYTNPGDTVLDFTMGSGSTGVACKWTGRNFIGMELDPEHFKNAKARILGENILRKKYTHQSNPVGFFK